VTSSTSPQPAEPFRFSTLAEYVDTLDDVTDGHVEGFHEQGYITVRQAVDAEAAAEAAQAMWDLIDDKSHFDCIMVEETMEEKFSKLSGVARRNAVRKIMNFVDYDERLKVLAEHPGILSVVQRLMGEPPVLFQQMGLMKPPRGRQKPWHQDCAYFTASVDTTVVGVWIALDSATVENGCLHLIPGPTEKAPNLTSGSSTGRSATPRCRWSVRSWSR